MIDFLIYFGLLIGGASVIIAKSNHINGMYFIASAVFGILGIGILGSGWETYSVANFIINDTNSTSTTITAQLTSYPATVSANPILFGTGMLFVGLCLALIIVFLQENSKSEIAQKTE